MTERQPSQSSPTMPDLSDIYDARLAISRKIRRTPLVRSDSLSALVGAPVHLKFEHHQITGSFKLRGATYAVHRLSAEQRAKGVVAVSTGNHGRALAQAAKDAGLRSIVCMSSLVPKNKVEAIRALGAEVRIVGDTYDKAEIEADRLVAEDGLTTLPPFDHPQVIAGQGTLGLEVMEALPRVDTLIVPLSGGGLIAGVALAAKSIRPSLRVLGVTMEFGAAMYESLKAGRPIPVEERPSLADALGGGIGLDNRYTFPMVRDLVDDVHLVSEDQIADGIRHAYWQEKQVIEGSGAAGIAALLAGLVDNPGTTAIVVSGCNIDMDRHKQVIDGEAVDSDGRL
jgi:threonine dehydratase